MVELTSRNTLSIPTPLVRGFESLAERLTRMMPDRPPVPWPVCIGLALAILDRWTRTSALVHAISSWRALEATQEPAGEAIAVDADPRVIGQVEHLQKRAGRYLPKVTREEILRAALELPDVVRTVAWLLALRRSTARLSARFAGMDVIADRLPASIEALLKGMN